MAQWRFLARFAGVGAVLGVIVALCTPKTFTAGVTLAPEMSSGGIGLSGNLADMASNFGIDIGGNSAMDAIYPELYPDIFATTDFLLSLYDVPVRLKEDNTEKKYIEHLKKDFKMPFWTYPKIWLAQLMTPKDTYNPKKGGVDPFKISKEDNDIIEGMRGCIICTVDKKTSIITISVTDQDPLICATLADSVKTHLQQAITNYRTQKARVDLEYNQKLFRETKARYEKARQTYAAFADANQDVILESVRSKRADLENEMQIQYNAYTQVAAQLTAASARVQEETPAFTTIQRATVPVKKAGPARAKKLLIFLFLAFLGTTVWAFHKEGDLKPLLGL